MLPSVMPRERSVDIDNQLDFEWAQWLYLRQQGEPSSL
jgi:CMP-N-acetylneuraminic acid synthetase